MSADSRSLFATDGERQLTEWLRAFPEAALAQLAERYGSAAAQGGAVVTHADDHTTPIPLLLSPVVVPADTFTRISDDAHTLVGTLVKLTRRLMASRDQQPFRGLLFGRFSAVETAGLAEWRNAERLATARVDFLIDHHGDHRALEVNATIPAMQGYSDAVASAWLASIAAARGVDAAPLIAANGSNGDDLLASLIAHHQSRQGQTPRTIAIVARAHDAQLGELRRYAATWREKGYDVALVTPAELTIGSDGLARAGTMAPDLIYRHVFARRLSVDEPFTRMCLDPERFGVLNPISSHLEVKGMLGLLSAALDEPAEAERIGLTDDEQATLRRLLPWTRLIYPQDTPLPDGTRGDLRAFVTANGPELVLKRSWDYGGKGVFLGADLDGDDTQKRLTELTGLPRPTSWPTLCDWVFDGSEEAWVVQSLVQVRQAELLLVGVGDKSVVAHPLYVDLSAFTNWGVEPRPSGGAARAAFGRIVNIQGGGGLSPVIREPVLQQLLRR